VEEGKAVLRGSLKNASPALSLDEQTVFASIKQEAIALDADTGDEIWRVEIASKGFGSRHPNYAPTVSNDGAQVYYQSKDGLWALDPATGASLWLFVPEDGQRLQSAVALGADGTIYIGATKKKSSHFYALDPSDGSIVWKHVHTNKGKFSNNQAAVGADGKVYVALGKEVFCFDGAGDGNGGSSLVWSMPLPGKIESGVVIGGPGVLYVGAGKNLWKITD
jgi:outer membrane protein assembly factor BamB